MTDITDRIKEALEGAERDRRSVGLDEANWNLSNAARTLLPEAIEEIKRLEAKLAEVLGGQPYTYYGKDGKPILARDLEDRTEAAEAKLAVAVEAAYREGFRDGGWVFGSDHEDKSWIDSNARAALAEIKV